jgi:hypothetical protein
MAQSVLRTTCPVAVVVILAACATLTPQRERVTVYVNDSNNVAIAIFEPSLDLSEVAYPDRPEATEFGYRLTDCSTVGMACLMFAGGPLAIPRDRKLRRWIHLGAQFETRGSGTDDVLTVHASRRGAEYMRFRFDPVRGVTEVTFLAAGSGVGSPYRLYSQVGLLAPSSDGQQP